MACDVCPCVYFACLYLCVCTHNYVCMHMYVCILCVCDLLSGSKMKNICTPNINNMFVCILPATTRFLESLFKGSGNNVIKDLNCNGGETSLLDCSYNPYGLAECGHLEDIGLRCYS